MAFIGLSIVEPTNDAAIVGAPVVVQFKGAVISLPVEAEQIPLYYRWYSSSVARIAPDNKTVLGYSMNVGALTNLDNPFSHALAMGSHVITFVVSDRQGETDQDFQAIQHGGVTGGEKGPSRCVIHVFKANILDPQKSVSRANLVLTAEAPSDWGSEHYHGYNRLCYRWILEPVGTPSGRPEFDSRKLTRQQLTFNDGDSTNLQRVTYQPVLSVQVTGDYKITLWVEDALSQDIRSHSASVNVSLT